MSGDHGDLAGPRHIFGPRRVADPPPVGGNDDLAGLRRAFTRDPAVAPAPETCPTPETLWSALHGELSPTEARQVVDHTAFCPACAEDWRLGLAFEGEPQEAGAEPMRPHGVARPSRFRYPWTWKPLAAAAGIALTAIGVYCGQYLQVLQETITPAYRAGAQAGAQATIQSRVPAVLPRSHCLLQWYEVQKAVSYDIRVSTAELKEVAQARGLKKPEFLVPESGLAGVPAGSQIDWQVDALLADGARLPSKTFLTTIVGDSAAPETRPPAAPHRR